MNAIEPRDLNQTAIRFCECLLDPETQTLQTKHGFVRLRSKLWLVLIELTRQPNKLVLRESLVKDIWRGNNYTGEQGLTHAICHLRRILKSYNIPAKIITLPKKGYILQKENDVFSADSAMQSITPTQGLDVFNQSYNQIDNSKIEVRYTIG
ncbi:winged helix-turn-helix domain-containing protein [Aliikangiella coralliicola]|uniref:Winged helix-turn-helix transcriptional regulator n=1 Tax=Aliikangiella coralliicola TaxID=2592383 RepID=A0A545U7M3_9GAMM|nr:winged helix-turn-helix domain-containing protein [Aliikangiella coralliicola]TQV85470.1 winged helix-turn-helix transcriptional regulator [Aliikangiella coralliicola]